MDHYNSLVPGEGSSADRIASDSPVSSDLERSGSPAEWCLDHYLPDQLSQLPDAVELKDLRLDCLYLLTDRLRHRRALTGQQLLDDVNLLRRGTLELAIVDGPLLERVMEPLVRCRLVTKSEAAGGHDRFELAHDFAVRSVVLEWRRLNQERSIQEALRLRERKKAEGQAAELANRERTALRFLLIGPGIVNLLLAIFMAYLYAASREYDPLGAAAIASFSILFSGIFFVGVMTRAALSAAMGGIGLVGMLSFWNLWSRPAFLGGPREWFLLVAVMGFGILMTLYSQSLVHLSARLDLSRLTRRVLRVTAGELTDMMSIVEPALLVLLIAIGAHISDFTFRLLVLLLMASSATLGVAFIVRSGRTAGMASVSLRIRSSTGGRVGFLRASLRQILFIMWSAINSFVLILELIVAFGSEVSYSWWLSPFQLDELIPWMILTPLIVWSSGGKQNFYDSWAGTALVDAAAATSEEQSQGAVLRSSGERGSNAVQA
jgi:hypothetical protein